MDSGTSRFDGGVVIKGTALTAEGNADDLVIGNGSGTYGMTIYSGTSSVGSIYFSDGSSSTAQYEGYIEYNHSNNYLMLGANHANVMKLDSSGNVSIGAGTWSGTAAPLMIAKTASPTYLGLQMPNADGNSVGVQFRSDGDKDAFVGMIKDGSNYFLKLAINEGTLTDTMRGLAIGSASAGNSTNPIGIGYQGSLGNAKVTIQEWAEPLLSLNRTNQAGDGQDNGPMVWFYGGSGYQQGSISLSGSTISYNAFTGSHYATTAESIDLGMLVSMTGTNSQLHNNANSEILYGVVKSTTPNDSKLLGTYIMLLDPHKDASVDNPHLIASVGNGPMWIADKGANIAVGDYLISSDIIGHAMKDDGTYAVSYIIGRATENIDWSIVTDTVGETKHKLITVTYESFKNLEGKLTALEARVAALES